MSAIASLAPERATAARMMPKISPATHKILSSPEADLRVIASWIEADPALCSQVLRLANSPFYGHASEVASAGSGVMILGRAIIATICSATMLRSLTLASGATGFDGEMFWRQAVLVGCGAAQAAPKLGVVPETAFCAGLLHAIGSLLAALSGGLGGESMESLGASLADHWRLPRSISEAILLSGGDQSESAMGAAVRAGRLLAALPEEPTEGSVGVAPFVGVAATWSARAAASARAESIIEQVST